MSRVTRILAAAAVLALVPGAAQLQAQARGTVTGQVIVADTRAPLAGAQVSIPALNAAVMTDERGRFLLSNVRQGTHALQVTYIGYKTATQQVTVSEATANLTIEMDVDHLLLDELVVVGYGESRRRNLAGSVASLRPETVKDAPVASVIEVMQGRMPGIQITQNSGTPGAAMTVRVRGASSISGGNDPLYVVDGVPLNQGDFSRIANVSFGGQDIDAISDINPNEIESIEVLKDASAAAIYGSRASNGVVLIKTKRGMAARPEMTFGAYYGEQQDWHRVDLLNADQYLEIYGEGCRARYGDATCADLPGFLDSRYISSVSGVNTDWLNQVLRTAPMSSMDGSVRGGNERVRYYVAGSSVLQDGVVKSMGYSRLNGRVNLDYVPFDRLTLGTNVSLTRSLYTRARSDNTIYSAWSNALANPPIQPVFTDDGDYFETLYANPVGMNNEAEAKERGVRIIGNVFAQYNLLAGLTGRVSVGVDNLGMKSRTFDSPVFGPWASSGGAAEAASSYVNKLTYEGTLNFSRLLGTSHDVSGVVGTSYEENANEGFRVQGTQFPTEYFKYITSAATISDGSSSRTDYNLLSFFGRLSYTYNDRITTTFNVRRDGSSRFGEDNRYGTFPSASVMWRVGEETFMEGVPVRNLALRASYGLTGNQQDLGNFASRGLFGGGSNYEDLPGIAPTQLANPELKWEKTSQLNLGTDFSVLQDRLAFTVDWYNKQTEDLLVARPVPTTTGYNSIWDNVGSMENKGLEVAATARLFTGGSDGLNWTLTANVSRNRNKVLELYNDQPIDAGFANRVEEGKPLGFFYGHVTDGIFQSMAEVQAHATQTVHSDPRRATAPGDIRFKDIDGRDAAGNLTGQPDGKINDDDRAMIGNPWPDYEGGITNTLTYGPLDMTAFVSFSQGNDIYNGNRIYMDQYGSGGDNHSTSAMKRWRPDHTNTTEPRAIWGDPNKNTRDSDRFVEDGSYWRLKNIVLGYRLPSELIGRAGFRTARIYVQGQNVYTNTKYSGFDPEVNYAGQTSLTRGTDFYTLPQARTYTIGINVGF